MIPDPKPLNYHDMTDAEFAQLLDKFPEEHVILHEAARRLRKLMEQNGDERED